LLSLPTNADCVYLFATSPKHKAWRSSNFGSFYIYCLCEAIVLYIGSAKPRNYSVGRQCQNKNINNNSDVDMVSDDDDGIARKRNEKAGEGEKRRRGRPRKSSITKLLNQKF
jgi:hypothetical protein